MNVKRFLLASLAVFVTFQVLDFVIHGLYLAPTYESLASIWRPNMEEIMWVMYCTAAVLSLLFVYIFTKGFQSKGIMEGVRYGFLIGLLMALIGGLNQYVIYPVPLDLTIKWVVFGLIEFIAAGAVTALIYKPKA